MFTHNLAGSVGLFEHREDWKWLSSKGCKAVLRPLAAVNFTECSKIILLGRSCLSSFCLWSLDRELFQSRHVVLFRLPTSKDCLKVLSVCLCVLLWSPNFSGPQFPDLILSRLGIKSCGQDLLTVKPCYKCKVVSVNYWVLEGKAFCSILGLCIRSPPEEQSHCEYYGIRHLVEELDCTGLGGAG